MLQSISLSNKEILVKLFTKVPGLQVITKQLVDTFSIPNSFFTQLLTEGLFTCKRGNICISKEFARFLEISSNIKSLSEGPVDLNNDADIIKFISRGYGEHYRETPTISVKKRAYKQGNTRLDNQKEFAKEFLAGETLSEVDENYFKIAELARLYTNRVNEYNRSTNIAPVIDSSDTSYKYYAKAVKFAEELRVPITTYLDAQFYFFQSWFRRCPEFYELVGPKSKVRVIKYLKLDNKRNLEKGAVLAPKISQELKSKYSEKQLKVLMKNYGMDEEQVLKVFAVDSSAHTFFDPEWLNSNETYQKLKLNGEV